MKEYKIIPIEKLKFSKLRELRQHTVEQLKENIKQNGFDDARVLLVIPDHNGSYIVAGGNHRLQALIDLNIKNVPCLIDDEGDLYQLSIQDNEAEKTFAPIDLFDYLEMIQQLKEQGLTHEDISNKIKILTKKNIDDLNRILKLPKIIRFCKTYQDGRGNQNLPNGNFNFTEGWFRNSGLYDLNEEYQLKSIEACTKGLGFKYIKDHTSKYSKFQKLIKIAKKKLYDLNDLDRLIELIENNIFKSKEQFYAKIEDFNKDAKNKLIKGNCLFELEEIEDASIDIVITDPPYGIEYISNRSQKEDHITKQGVLADSPAEAFQLLDTCCSLLRDKTKPQAHIYIFSSWKVFIPFKKIIEKYFDLKNIIIWDKGVGGAGDLEGNWGEQYEIIFFASKGNKPLIKRKDNIIKVSRLNSSKMIHPTQKPVEVILQILEASAMDSDLICDPFMGSGSTIKACKKFGNLNYIGIELDPEIFEKAKTFIGE